MQAPERKPYHQPADAVWLITGCSSGIGQALAQHIAAQPHLRLVATARNTASLAYLPASARILKLALDVASAESTQAAVDAVLAKWGRLDVVVNNAGYGLMGDTENISEDEARALMETNFWGTVRVSKHAMRVMREENVKTGQQGGVIFNVTSMGGRIAVAGNAFYHASKFAVEGFTESIASEVRPEWGINCCLIEPGGVQTNYATSSMKTVPVHPAYAAADTPLRMLEAYIYNAENRTQWAPARSVAGAIYHLASRGQVLPLRVPLGLDAWGVLQADAARSAETLKGLKDIAEMAGSANQAELYEVVSQLR